MAGKSSKNKGKSKGGTNVKHPTESNPEGVAAECLVDHNKGDVSQNCEKLKLDRKKSDSIENAEDDAKIEKTVTEMPPQSIAPAGNEQSTKPTGTEPQVDGELRLYPMAVRGPAGEEIQLQVSPGDSIMDLRQFLLDAPETSFYTCYDLVLHDADGLKHRLADFYEIGDVADVTNCRCSLEMVNALYDDRSVRSHLRRTRDLLSITNIHSSLSTTLALEYEAKANTVAGEGKTEAPELDGIGFMDDFPSHIENLIITPFEPEITCSETIAFSSFNPAPGYRRLIGDLIYLDITTLEGSKYCVTAHTKGFFVNSSTGNILDPSHAVPVHEATTLVGLLRKLSDKFSKGFEKVLERKSQCHPFENVPALLPLNPWLGPYPSPPHKRDICRAEDALLPPYGTEIIGMQRDWNEELQSCREFPRTSLQDRIMRDRALYKVNSDFVDAAIKGAKGVIGRCIPPINPTDPERFHMYVHNNIFFSFAIDGDFTVMQQMHEKSLKEPGNANGDEHQKRGMLNERDKEEDSNVSREKHREEVKDDDRSKFEESKPATSVPDASEKTCDSVPADFEEKVSTIVQAQAESEQATYASANNDLKGTKAYNNTDTLGLYTLAMAIIDYRGHRIIAQSIIPGILQGDKSESLLYGSVDNGKKISWNEKFHSKILEASKVLHIKEHEVYDELGNTVKMAAPVECKGIIGSDDRHYLLDLMRITPRDANYTGPGSHYCILRPELIAAFCEAEVLERKKERQGEETIKEDASREEECPKVLLNPNVLTEFKLAGSSEEIAADEELVKKAGKYLIDVVIPKFLQDLNSLEVSPMDGQTLTDALHSSGINIRYLGKVASMAHHLPHILDLCVSEMIVRAAKHILKGVLREALDHDVAGAIAHFLNCFVDRDVPKESVSIRSSHEGQEDSNLKGRVRIEKAKKKGRSAQRKPTSNLLDSLSVDQNEVHSPSSKFYKLPHDSSSLMSPSYLCVSSLLVWREIFDFVKFKYQFDLTDDMKPKVRKIQTIRNLCLKVGVTLASRKYDFSCVAPFQTSDLLDLHAVVKHSIPLSADARDRLECGKLRLSEGKLSEAYEQFSEGFTILQQVCGPIHREVANCCRYLAMVLYHAGDMAGAIMQQHKELIINERYLGLDHPDTAHSYGNMALFYHGLNQTELALRHMARTLFLLNISSGADHPDVAATFINIAMMYQDVGRMNIALRYLQEALQKNVRLLGEEHIQTAVCYHALAIAFNCMGAYKLSLQHERSTYSILVKQLGEDDLRTRDSANWLKTFQMREMQAQKQKGQHAVTIAAAQKAAEALKARPDLLQALQAAAGGGIGRGSLSKAAATAALAGEALPRSRGMDERGARAAAEVRKKAVARGLNLRSQGVPLQALPPLTELISLINNGVPGKTSGNLVNSASPSNLDTEIGKQRITENVHTDIDTTKEPNQLEENEDPVGKSVEESCDNEITPLGLGIGLGALDIKKSKQKQTNL